VQILKVLRELQFISEGRHGPQTPIRPRKNLSSAQDFAKFLKL